MSLFFFTVFFAAYPTSQSSYSAGLFDLRWRYRIYQDSACAGGIKGVESVEGAIGAFFSSYENLTDVIILCGSLDSGRACRVYKDGQLEKAGDEKLHMITGRSHPSGAYHNK